ncbi:AAA family ATPase [Bradyrhizobium sp. DASA03068]|uniref:AAA family ATPase n=1 Tax=Bradyrhizobium sp. BLXBL-01 TaxID=3395915 RepID=UPI003F70D6F2
MTPGLKSLSIQNFRSIRGAIVVPLDAQVVLIHGTNGMGKTSVLSALELGLTGAIAHLEDQSNYHDFLTNIGTAEGSIHLTTSGKTETTSGEGRVTFKPGTFSTTPALDEVHTRFFAERCYLPQAVLGRLLEFYDQKKTTNSRLTLFVNELLRLDPLDALVDGLNHAFNVTRIRKIAPAYRELEAALQRLDQQIAREQTGILSAQEAVNARLTRLNDLVMQLHPTMEELPPNFNVGALREQVSQGGFDEMELSRITQERSELNSLSERLAKLGESGPEVDLAVRQREEAKATSEYTAWLNDQGAEIIAALDELRKFHSELSRPDADIGALVNEALAWCEAEIERCQRLLNQHELGSKVLATAQATAQRAAARIQDINDALAARTRDAKTLANALAGIAPHVEADMCPVCNRDFSELDKGSLTSHIAATIANLTSEAGRLQALANERASESERLATARRDEVSAERMVLSAEARVDWLRRQSSITSIKSKLDALREEATVGAQLFQLLEIARRNLIEARRADLSSSTILPDIQAAVERVTGRPLGSFTSLQEGLKQADNELLAKQAAVRRNLSTRITAESELGQYERETQLLSERIDRARQLSERERSMKDTFTSIGNIRDTARHLATAASRVRTGIVRDVFSGSLNTVWRDLFVRLAPNEQFVPQFRLPAEDDGRAEAILETLHRSGQSSGPPGAMLSQGNLNTAALTLFLALNLSVPSQLPWLILDDPVQSMDDVHIAQFAALLRTFSKKLGKQIVVAVHERALFDYLTLELSPAFAGDSLVTVEISRNLSGETVADPRYFVFEQDKIVAA